MSQSIVITLACYGTLEIVGVNYYYIIKTRTRYGVTPQTLSHPAWKPLLSTRTQLVMSLYSAWNELTILGWKTERLVGSLAATVHHGLHCRRQSSDQLTTLPSSVVGTTVKKKKVPYGRGFCRLCCPTRRGVVCACLSTWSDGHGSVPALAWLLTRPRPKYRIWAIWMG